jgi:molybdenum cofactor cytidylyltransferase
MSIGVIILAAGSSSRMGKSKQLLTVSNDESLLFRAARIALQCEAGKVIVVLGSNESLHRNAIKSLPVEIIYNADWESGVGSSIKAGLKRLLLMAPDVRASIVMVCDQPLLVVGHLKKIISVFNSGENTIVASTYSNTVGTPALFERSLFKEILTTDNSQGAKKIIESTKNVATVAFKDGAIDLDTPEDYNNFLLIK